MFKLGLKILALTGLILLTLPAPLRAQEPALRFEHISTEQGLSHSSVIAICQDSQGFMWFGTQAGLNKYDGYRFTTYQHDPQDVHSLSDSSIWAIWEDREGALWVGTNGGLNKFDRATEKFTRYQHDPDNPRSLSHNLIWSIYEDRTGTLWIGTDGGGLNKFDRASQTFTAYQHDPNNPHSLSHNQVVAIYEDRAGNLWLGTWGGGLNKFDRASQTFTAYQHDPNNSHSLSSNQVWSIYEDQAGTLWIGSWDGLNKFDPASETFTAYQHDPNNPFSLSSNDVRAIYEDQAGMLWIGADGGGLNKFDSAAGTFIAYQHNPDDPSSLSWNGIRSIYEDRMGTLWIGTKEGGLNKFDRAKEKFVTYRHNPLQPGSLSSNNVRAIFEDQTGLLWIGTANNGLNKFDRAGGVFTLYQHDSYNPGSLSDDGIWSIYEDRTGTLWIGTDGGGLNKFDRASQTFTSYQHNPTNPASLSHNVIYTIYEDKAGHLWLGSGGGGLDRFDPASETFTHYRHQPYDPRTLGDDFIRSIYEDRTGMLWLGTDHNGLDKFDLARGIFTHYRHDPDNPASLSHDQINVVYEDQAGTLWVGADGGGLNKFDRVTESFIHFTEKDGLPSNAILGILEDTGQPQDGWRLWLSTAKGLVKFNPHRQTFRNYSVEDGVQANEFNRGAYHKSHSGEMFFGGINGFNAFYPEQIKDNPYPPQLALTAFQTSNEAFQLNQPLSRVKEINLSSREAVFSIEFAALHYMAPPKNRYAYRLEGFDPDWIETDANRRWATYTQLQPGHYRFWLKAANADGVWSEPKILVNLLIDPPPWQTWWAYTLYALGAGTAIFGFVRLRTQTQARKLERQRQMNEALEAKVAARTRRLEIVASLSQQLNAILDVDQLLAELVNQVKEKLGYYYAQVYLLDDQGQNLVAAAGTSPAGAELKARGFQISLTAPVSLVARAARTGEIVMVDDVQANPNWLFHPLLSETKAEIAVPITIKAERRVVGVLDVQVNEVATLDESDVNLLRSLANQVSVAMENARLYGLAQQELAERARLISELDAFAYTIAHDLQNPLSIIMAYTELLAEEWATPEDIQASTEVIARNGYKMKEIMKELLLLAKTRDLEVELEPLDMARIVNEAWQRLVLLTEKRQAQLILPATWPPALGHAPWVEEVWFNYLSNAIKYGGQPPHLELGALTQPDGFVRFWVRDNGRGLSLEEQRKLFVPFTQLDQGREGHGLGLVIVQRIVEKLGGQVGVESAGLGQGCMFCFTLPGINLR